MSDIIYRRFTWPDADSTRGVGNFPEYPTHRQDQQLKEVPLKDGINDHINDALGFVLVNLFPIKSRTAGIIEW